MEDSDSFAVDFSGVHLERADLLGGSGRLRTQPWFTAGASRSSPCKPVASSSSWRDFGAFLRRREQHEDPIQTDAFRRMRDRRTDGAAMDECVRRGMDAHTTTRPVTVAETELLVTVDAARSAVERSALDVAERVERGVGRADCSKRSRSRAACATCGCICVNPRSMQRCCALRDASLTPRAIN